MTETSTTVVEEELLLRSADQTALFLRRIRPPGSVRACLAWVHGFAEHGGRYLPTLRWLAERGYESNILDLRGHGRSDGRRAFVRRFGDYSDDVEAFLVHLGRQPGGRRSSFWAAAPEGSSSRAPSRRPPLFALGHSMGGLVLARTLQDRAGWLPALRGAVLLSPFLGFKLELPLWKVMAGGILSHLCPRFALPAGIHPRQLSKDPAVGEAYTADPLVSRKATARWFAETTSAQGVALAEAHRLTLPLLVMHGEADELADVEVTRRFHARLGGAEKELVLWPGARHELLNEVEKEQVRERLLGWLEARLAEGS